VQIRAIEINSAQTGYYCRISLLLAASERLQISASWRYYPPKAEVVSSNLAGCAIVSVRVHGCPEFIPGESKLAVYEFWPKGVSEPTVLVTYNRKFGESRRQL
jgi:hypothetical protein